MYHAAMGAMQGMNLLQIYARIEDVLWDTQKVGTRSRGAVCAIADMSICFAMGHSVHASLQLLILLAFSSGP
jgi:hypothetical protein